MLAIDRLIAAINNEDWPFVREAISKVAKSKDGPALMASSEFHEVWTTKGHRVREQILNDGLLLDALRKLLPPYEGAGLTLYRGENTDRWKDGACGFAWTPKEDVARMFARGLNAIHVGGVLLSAEAPIEAIIAGPNEHSKHLQEDEYVVDWEKLGKITVLERFPRS